MGSGHFSWLGHGGHSHDHADSVDDALRDSAAGIRAVKISLVVLGLTAAAQLAIVALSGSVALFADTVHNFSDALTAVPLWIAFSMSRRAATRRYTYGFGRVEDLAGLFVVAVIAISAVVAAVEAVRRLIDPVPLAHLGWVAAAGVIGFLGNEVVAALPHSGRQPHRVGRLAGRRNARARRRFDVIGGGRGRHWRGAGFPAADPIVGLVIAVRHRRRVDLRRTRCVRQAVGPRRPRPGRQRCHGAWPPGRESARFDGSGCAGSVINSKPTPNSTSTRH